MDDWERLLSFHLAWIMPLLMCGMAKSLADKLVEAEKEKLARELGHEPTEEDWQYYCDLKRQQVCQREARQREIDREKIRRLVMGDNDAANQAK
jgi:hypothetical protein